MFEQKHSLEFCVLSDAGNKVARQFRIVFSLDPGFKTAQEQFGVDIPAYNGGMFELPIPATFLVSAIERFSSPMPKPPVCNA